MQGEEQMKHTPIVPLLEISAAIPLPTLGCSGPHFGTTASQEGANGQDWAVREIEPYA